MTVAGAWALTGLVFLGVTVVVAMATDGARSWRREKQLAMISWAALAVASAAFITAAWAAWTAVER